MMVESAFAVSFAKAMATKRKSYGGKKVNKTSIFLQVLFYCFTN